MAVWLRGQGTVYIGWAHPREMRGEYDGIGDFRVQVPLFIEGA